MKIIAVGMNYARHNEELGHTLENKEPVIFMKPDSAILKDGKPFFIPDFSNEVHYETELVVRINRLGKNIASRFAHRYYDAVTVGIDFTARDLQRRFREAGNPWELCKGFDSSAAICTGGATGRCAEFSFPPGYRRENGTAGAYCRYAVPGRRYHCLCQPLCDSENR